MMPFKNTIILEKITIQTEVYSINDTDRVEFYIDDELKFVDDESPYEWLWNEKAFGTHEIQVIAYSKGNDAKGKIDVLIFNIR